jgi:hypothetical protein
LKLTHLLLLAFFVGITACNAPIPDCRETADLNKVKTEALERMYPTPKLDTLLTQEQLDSMRFGGHVITIDSLEEVFIRELTITDRGMATNDYTCLCVSRWIHASRKARIFYNSNRVSGDYTTEIHAVKPKWRPER